MRGGHRGGGAGGLGEERRGEERRVGDGGRQVRTAAGQGLGEEGGYTPEYTTIRRGPKSRFVPSCLSGNDGTQHANVQQFQPIKRRGWKTALRQCLPVGSWIVKSRKEWCAGGRRGRVPGQIIAQLGSYAIVVYLFLRDRILLLLLLLLCVN